MERNQSTLGRIFRISGGLFVLSLSLLGPQAIWGLLGIVPLVSGLTGFDPVYGILAVLGRSLVPVPTALHTRL
jgi:hypothetical protein